MKRLNINIKTLSPVVLTASKGETVLTEAQDYINGSIIRGIFAKRYIDINKIENAHEDADFCKLFFGEISYVNAMPLCNGKKAFAAPRSLQKAKAGSAEDGKIADMIFDSEMHKGFKGCRGIVTIEENKLRQAYVDKHISLHMSRSEDNERIAGKSINGEVFNYEAVAAGQVFQGEIIGSEEIIKEFMSKLDLKKGSSIECRIGRSRFTQYGSCLLTIGELEDIPALNKSEKIAIRLETPFIPAAGNAFNCRQALQEIADELGNVSVGSVFGAIEEIDNFVNIWGLRRARVNAVSAGTVFVLEKQNDSWSNDELEALQNIMYAGAGCRTEEGFGQLRQWNENTLTAGENVNCYPVYKNKDKITGTAAEVAQKIVRKYVIGKLRQYAFADANKLNKNFLKGKAHFFTRIDTILGDKTKINKVKSVRDEFAKKVQDEIQPTANNFSNNLDDISIGHYSLRDLLINKKEIPYLAEWKKDLSNTKTGLNKLIKKIGMKLAENDIADGEYFYEYWHWFFRYARKCAVEGKNREGGEI